MNKIFRLLVFGFLALGSFGSPMASDEGNSYSTAELPCSFIEGMDDSQRETLLVGVHLGALSLWNYFRNAEDVAYKDQPELKGKIMDLEKTLMSYALAGHPKELMYRVLAECKISDNKKPLFHILQDIYLEKFLSPRHD